MMYDHLESKLHDWLNEIEVATTDCSLIDGSDELNLIDLIVYESIAINIIYCDIRCENLSSYSSVWSSEQTDLTQLYDSNPNEERIWVGIWMTLSVLSMGLLWLMFRGVRETQFGKRLTQVIVSRARNLLKR